LPKGYFFQQLGSDPERQQKKPNELKEATDPIAKMHGSTHDQRAKKKPRRADLSTPGFHQRKRGRF